LQLYDIHVGVLAGRKSSFVLQQPSWLCAAKQTTRHVLQQHETRVLITTPVCIQSKRIFLTTILLVWTCAVLCYSHSLKVTKTDLKNTLFTVI